MNRKNQHSEGLTASVPRILLTDTTRWAIATRVAIGLSKAGSEVSVLCPGRHPSRRTSAVRQTFPYRGLSPLDSLAAAIEASDPQMVIPCDDRGVGHLHELYVRACSLGASGSALAALIERSLGSPESHAVVSSRYDLLKVAREEGIRVPDTKVIEGVDDLKSWHAQQAVPWVLKADGTWGGGGVKIVRTIEEAEQCFLELTRLFRTKRVIKRLCVNRDSFWLRPWWKNSRPAVVVQSHIQGRPANCAVVCWQGRVLAGVGVEVVSADGLTGPASVVRIVDSPEMKLAAERIACRLGLSGFFGLDFMIEDRSGASYLIEMNPRATPVCHLRLGKGRDMVGALSAQLSGQPFREVPPVTQNDMVAYFPQAWAYKNEFVETSFQDIPEGEPELVEELLRPWPDQSFLFRAINYLQRTKNLVARSIKRRSSRPREQVCDDGPIVFAGGLEQNAARHAETESRVSSTATYLEIQ